MKTWCVRILRSSDNVVVKEMPCASESMAERIDRGVNINLDAMNYHTEIACIEDEKSGP